MAHTRYGQKVYVVKCCAMIARHMIEEIPA